MTAHIRLASTAPIVLACMVSASDAAGADAGRALRSPASISENLKVPFIANQGQHDESVRFCAGVW